MPGKNEILHLWDQFAVDWPKKCNSFGWQSSDDKQCYVKESYYIYESDLM